MRGRSNALRACLAIAVVLAAAAGVTWMARGSRAPSRATVRTPRAAHTPRAAVPAPVPRAFTIGAPVRLKRAETRSRFAPVLRPVVARLSPAPGAPRVATLSVRTPERTSNIVLAVGQIWRGGVEWVHVRLPVLPNNETGWVRRSALGGYRFVHTHLVVNRERFTAVLFYDGRPIFSARVGVGRPEAPTPAGQFYVRDKLVHVTDPFYGPVAFGTSARSAVLTDWPAGGFVGIHGTNQPQLIPGRISHGCIRMRNADILRLSALMPVGTSLTVR